MSITLLSCTDVKNGNSNSVSPSVQTSPKNANHTIAIEQTDNFEDNEQPLLTLDELLGAMDVKLALAKAAEEGNTPVLEYWQKQLLTAAEEVNLAPEEVALIEGPQGLKFLEFQGMKTNYQRAFDEAFYHFQDVDAVYNAFPAFENLHKRSKELIKQRDLLIQKVVSELESNGFQGDALQEARTQWQNFIINKTETEKQPS